MRSTMRRTGDLDRRGVGDVQTLTVDEYRGPPWSGRLGYRLFRNPFVMFVLGPFWVLLSARARLVGKSTESAAQSVLGTDLTLIVVVATLMLAASAGGGSCSCSGPPLLVRARPASGSFTCSISSKTPTGGRDVVVSTTQRCKGSSYLDLPRVLQFFTGNIGLHHVHHLSARIPNYNLQAAHDENACTTQRPDALPARRLRALRG